MVEKTKTLAFLGDYIDGAFVRPKKPDMEWKSISPADLRDEVLHVQASLEHVDEACRSAREAFPAWSHMTFEERKPYLLRLKEVFNNHADEMAEIISRETGKPLWETKTEAKALSNKIDITVNESIKLVQDVIIPDALPGVKGRTLFKPRGVMAVVGPFNFPAHLPNGHIIPALATGNTVVFKPSELTPAVGMFYAQLVEKAGFPKGVFNLVQGKGDVGERLVMSELVDGVLFTGSYEVGLKIKQATMTHFWKVLALEMGGKNAAIVCGDADLEKAVYENIVGCFSSTGQRCSCTSRLILDRKIADKFIDKFYGLAKKLSIGHWSGQNFMGPLISETAVEKYIRFQGIAKRENAESLMRGKTLELNPQGHYVTPSINLIKGFDEASVYQKTEIFGPNVMIFTVDDFEQALEINNSTGFGLVTSVFSQDKSLYEKTIADSNIGLVNWNRSTVGASSRMPFGGWGKSGNNQPSAHFAVYYCTYPVACLEDTSSFDRMKTLPGIKLED